ncbi:MAG TPA: hypothetical protein VI318_22385 [Baekduia sp.]
MPDTLQETVTTKRLDFREVGLREGLQSHGLVVPTAQKLDYFARLKEAGARELNVVSFVHPRTMPQMADAETFLRALGPLREDTVLSGVVPNDKGLERAIAMRAEGLLDTIFLIFAESTSTLAANRMTATHAELLAQIERAAARAAEAGLNVSVFVSAAYGCSIEGRIDPQRVVDHAAQIWAMDGVGEIIISDSTGQADPLQVHELLTEVATVLPADQRLGVHLHDTRGAGLANLFAALTSPFEHLVVDAAFGGWGGDWPFIPEAFGNVATEDVVEMLIGMGFDPGIDVAAVMAVTKDYAQLSGRPIGAKLVDAQPIAWKRERLAARA